MTRVVTPIYTTLVVVSNQGIDNLMIQNDNSPYIPIVGVSRPKFMLSSGRIAGLQRYLPSKQLQGQLLAPVTFATLGLPEALTVIVLCCVPTVGVARQSVRLANVAPTPVG